MDIEQGKHVLKKLGRATKLSQAQKNLRVPPEQYVTEKFPVMTFGQVPDIALAEWQIKLYGLVKEEIMLDWRQFASLPRVTVNSEFHCVTQWSRLGNKWEGVLFSELIGLTAPRPEATHVMIHCYGGYTTNLPLDILLDEDVLFADRHDDTPLAKEHGGPLRLVVPKRYGWKSAKWVKDVELIAGNTAGFWESRGYHMDGDPWKEQRFWDRFDP